MPEKKTRFLKRKSQSCYHSQLGKKILSKSSGVLICKTTRLTASHANTLKSYLWVFMTEYVWKCNTICFPREARNTQREIRNAPACGRRAKGFRQLTPCRTRHGPESETLFNPLRCTDRNRQRTQEPLWFITYGRF